MSSFQKPSVRCLLAALWTAAFIVFSPLPVKAASEADSKILSLPDGEYSVQVTLVGGSGKASIVSPTLLTVSEAGVFARIQWSSSNYDYMIVDHVRYNNTSEEGRPSVFLIPVTAMDTPMPVIADTTAMGGAHEIPYALTFSYDSIGAKSRLPQEAAKRVAAMAGLIIVAGGILNYFVNQRRNREIP